MRLAPGANVVDSLEDWEWKELKIFLSERRIGRQMRAAAQRDWEKREGYKLFKECNLGNTKTTSKGTKGMVTKKFWFTRWLATITGRNGGAR